MSYLIKKKLKLKKWNLKASHFLLLLIFFSKPLLCQVGLTSDSNLERNSSISNGEGQFCSKITFNPGISINGTKVSPHLSRLAIKAFANTKVA